MTAGILDLLDKTAIFDLAQPYYAGMPHHPNHPPYLFGLNKIHGDYISAAGASSASETLLLGGHTGTHIDALAHFSSRGLLYGGRVAAEAQSRAGGLQHLSIDTVAPVLRRGVLLDVAAHLGVDALPADFEITPGTLDAVLRAERVTVEPGDVVLLRTGWGRFWQDAARYVSQVRGPGPEGNAARWLSAAGVFAAGSDTLAFEFVPAPDMPVHVHLLVESGIHIIENLNLEELSAARVYSFVFIALPLKFRGGTASPIRPLALVEGGR